MKRQFKTGGRVLKRFCFMTFLWLIVGVPISGICKENNDLVSTPSVVAYTDFYYPSESYYEYDDYSIGCETPCYNYGINPLAIPGLPCGWNVFFTADFLYWQVRSDELPYATKTIPLNLPGQTFILEVERLKPHTRPGVRLGIDYLLPCFDGWNFAADWTYLHSKTNARVSANLAQGEELDATWSDRGLIGGVDFAANAEASYAFNMNLADLSLGRCFYVGKRLTLRPTAGARGAWIQQNFDVTYRGGTLPNTLFCNNKINFKAGGIRTGLDTEWNLGCGFGFVASTHLDVLWSKFDVSQKNELGAAPRTTIDDSIHGLTPVIELFLGLVWENTFCQRFYFNAHVGWEEQYFINMIQWNQFTSQNDQFAIVRQKGGLGLSGLTAGVSFGF